MRCALVLGGMLALFAVTCPARSQTPLPTPGQQPPTPAPVTAREAYVTVPEALVYSGPSTQLYPTSKLPQGARVKVLRPSPKNPDWLEIEPPKDSFSWINSLFIGTKVREQNGIITGFVVAAEDVPVPVKAGSLISDQEPNVEITKAVRGTQVIILDERTKFTPPGGSGGWVKVEPMPSEVRYLQASALERGQGIQVVTAQTPPAGQFGQPQAGATDPTVQRLSQQLQTLTPAQKQQLIGALGGVPAAQQPGNPNNVAASGPGYPAGQLVSNPGQQSGQNVALYNTNPGAAAPANPALNQAQWSSWGKLTKASFQKDGQQVYALLTNQGGLVMYAVPERGKTLEDYVGRTVALYGFVTYRDDAVRAHLMTVYYVSPPQ